jgi:hypothetical protein
MSRAARLRPFTFTFSNSVTIPACTLVSGVPAANASHRDETFYPGPDDFDGFRFAKLRKSEGVTVISKYQAHQEIRQEICRERLEMISLRPMRRPASTLIVHLQRDSSSSAEALKA